tara:strand:+ start:2260 stop:3174 length:915 start_codon:yes stop_codon:yes gene_type:complete
MFKKTRPRYAVSAFGRRKFPQVPRSSLTIDQIIENYSSVSKIVTQNSKVSSIGSCFAEEILLWMKQNNFNVIEPTWGMVYNPKNIRLIIEGGLEYNNFNPTERFWDFGDGDIRSPYVKSSKELSPIRLGATVEKAKTNEAKLFKQFGDVLKSVETLIITLGQTEYWATEKQYPFYAAPWVGIKDGDKNHKAYNLSQQEVKDELNTTISVLKEHNPNINILISVSPVPLVASILEGDSAYIAAGRAKSTLHSATLEVVDEWDRVYYMPSYEIVTSKPESSFKPDGRHVLSSTVSTIMETFKKLFT